MRVVCGLHLPQDLRDVAVRVDHEGRVLDAYLVDHTCGGSERQLVDSLQDAWQARAMANPDSYTLGPGEGRQIDLGDGFAVAVKADEHGTGGVVSVLETEEPPGFGPPMHVHHDCAEAFYVLEGEYVMYLDEREVVCPAGSFIFISQGARHGFRTGHAPSRKLNFYFPASMVGYFDDLASALEREDVAEAELAEIAAAHAMEIVGPSSESYV